MKEYTLSYWNKTVKKEQYPSLDSDLNTDVLIIGGGITGITCAYFLAQKGVNPVLIEAEKTLCGGTTGNTTGKITIQHDNIYSTIINKHGPDFAKRYAMSQSQAVKLVNELVRKHAIDCQLFESTAYFYASTQDDIKKVEKEYDAARHVGIDAVLIQNPGFPEKNYRMLGYPGQAVFHPVRYVEALAKAAVEMGAKIYCGTKALKVEDGEWRKVTLEDGLFIKARHLVMATQYPIYDGPNLFYTRLYAKRAYGIAVDARREWPDGSYISAGKPARSIRTHVENGKRVLIVVGESHATARGEPNMKEHYDRLIQFAERIAGVREIYARWSAQDYETPDSIPYIGRISDHSRIYVASGFGKWGLSNGTLVGSMIADLITTGNSAYEEVYSRKRGDYSSAPIKTVSEVLRPVGELIASKFKGTESLKDISSGEGRVVRYHGEIAGAYRDYDDNVTIINITCSHMGTELKFNTAEKTWDCPAHGGRYTVEGKLIEGPPKDSMEVFFRGKYEDLDE